MGNPYAQGVLAEAKIYSSVHVDYSTPEDAAAIALSVKNKYQHSSRLCVKSISGQR